MKKTVIVGGGAAGFFLAINLKEMCPEMDVTILERGKRVLRKVEVSGGGRCNLTNTFSEVSDIRKVYPRGARLLKGLFKKFGHREAWRWFNEHGVELVQQPNGHVFPKTQDSHTIINCLLSNAQKLGVKIITTKAVESINELYSYDYICITAGGQPSLKRLEWIANIGIEVVKPVPSLFSLSIDDERLRSLTGTVIENVAASLVGTKIRSKGDLLITHWGLSGPAILLLTSYGARLLNENDYKAGVAINWLGKSESEAFEELKRLQIENPMKNVANCCPQNIQHRLWGYLTSKVGIDKRWSEIGQKDFNRMVNVLTNDVYLTAGRAPFKDEFVTCGGVSLSAVDRNTLECFCRPNLYFAGEVLDIDGVTGGFNFQAAWTTAFTVAQAIALSVHS